MAIVASQLIGTVEIVGADAAALTLGRLFSQTEAGNNIFTRLGNGIGNIAFGFRNLGEAGSIGTEAIQQGFAQVGTSLLTVGAIAAAALGVVIVKTTDMAANFQQGVNRLRTGAGDMQDSFNTLSNGIKSVAVATGTATNLLIPAMYLIASSGQRGAQAFDTLRVAAEGAKIEQASVADVANVLSGVMTNYGSKLFGATQYMNGLMYAVAHGKITLQDLAVAMGPIDPIAQHLGISFSDMAAAMTTQTNAMIPAHIAATGLRFLMQGLENPTKKATDAMTAMGLNSITVAEEMKKSLPDALEMVYNAALKAGPAGSVPFNRALADMVGGIRGTTAFMALTGPHFADFAKNAAGVAAAMKSGAGGVTGWAQVQGNFNLQMDKAKASLEVLGITIGQALLPVLTKIVTAITPIIVAVTNWLVQNNAIIPIIAGLAGLIGGTLVAALVALVVAFWPVFAIGAGIGLLVAGIILAVQHWGQIMQWIGNVMSTVGTFVHGVLSAIGGWFGNVFSAIGTTVRNTLTGIKDVTGSVFSAIGTTIRDVLTGIKNFVGGVFSAIGTGIRDALTGIKNFFGNFFDWLYNHNIYWKAIVDGMPKELQRVASDIGTILNDIKTFFGNVFSAIGTFVHDRLVWIQNTVGAIFSAIGTFIHDRLTWIYNTVGAIFSAIGTFIHNVLSAIFTFIGGIFSAIGSLMSGKANDAKNAVSGAFSGLVNAVGNILGGFWRWISNFFGGLAGAAFQWGANLIGNLISGIGSMVGNLMSQVGTIANNIAGFLGFHSPPKQGPMRDADKWMPNMMNMFMQGIVASTPNLRRALGGALVPMSTSLSVGTSGLSSIPGGLSIPLPIGMGAGVSSSGRPTPLQVNLWLDGQRLTSAQMPYIANALRYNLGGFGR